MQNISATKEWKRTSYTKVSKHKPSGEKQSSNSSKLKNVFSMRDHVDKVNGQLEECKKSEMPKTNR